jgi:hypothetical protein
MGEEAEGGKQELLFDLDEPSLVLPLHCRCECLKLLCHLAGELDL